MTDDTAQKDDAKTPEQEEKDTEVIENEASEVQEENKSSDASSVADEQSEEVKEEADEQNESVQEEDESGKLAEEEDESSVASEQSEEAEEEEIRSSLMEQPTSPGKTRGKQAKNTGRNWYVIHTYSGYEDAVEKSLRQRIETFNMQDYIFDVIVPKESAISIKKGSHVTEKIRMFPGYVLVDMIVTDDSWYVVRNTPNVTGFVGSGTIPVPVLPEEFEHIKKHTQQEEPKFKIKFQIGENVQVIDGPFKDCEGLIDDIDEKKGRAKILVNVFGRETPIELEFTQIKKKQ